MRYEFYELFSWTAQKAVNVGVGEGKSEQTFMHTIFCIYMKYVI